MSFAAIYDACVLLNVIDLDDELFMERFNRQAELRAESAKKYGYPIPTAKEIAHTLDSEGLRKSGQSMPEVSKQILKLLA